MKRKTKGIALVTALQDGSLDFINQRFRECTGLPPDQLLASGCKSAVHRDDVEQLETWWRELRQTQEAGTLEVRLRQSGGAISLVPDRGETDP